MWCQVLVLGNFENFSLDHSEQQEPSVCNLVQGALDTVSKRHCEIEAIQKGSDEQVNCCVIAEHERNVLVYAGVVSVEA